MSRRHRREGREAFRRQGNPDDHNPYADKGGLSYDIMSADWLAGWREAEAHDEMARKREEREMAEDDEKVEEFARLYNLAKSRGLLDNE